MSLTKILLNLFLSIAIFVNISAIAIILNYKQAF